MKNPKNKLITWLRWSEKYLKTDMVYLAKGGFWLSLGQGIAMISGFLVSIAFANLFPKESFGNYKYILAVTGILSIFSLTGLGTSIIQSVARGFGGALRQGFRINLKWSLGILLGGLVCSLYYYLQGNMLFSLSFLLAGILSPLAISGRLYSAYLNGKKDFRRSSFYGMVNNILPAATLIATLLLTQNIFIIIIVYFSISALVPLFLYRATLRAYQQENKEEDPEIITYSGHLSIMEIIGQIASQLDKILIFHYLGAAPLAIYAFAVAPVEQLQGGKKILSTLILPKLSEQSFEKLQKSAPRKALILTAYALIMAGIYVLLVPYFYKFFYPQYLDSVPYSQVYSLTLLAIAGSVFNETLQAHKKKKELYISRTIMPVIQIGLYLVILPIFGLMGLIVANVITRFLSGLVCYYFVKYPLSETLPR